MIFSEMTEEFERPDWVPDWVQITSAATLKKYGLTQLQWLEMLRDQDWKCPICDKQPGTGRFVVDHFHTRGFKKMAAEDKRKWIRGITDWHCNHAYLGRGITVEKARNVVTYLEVFESRKPST